MSRLVKGRKRHILMDTFGALIALRASGSPAQASCRALEDSSAKCAGDYRKGGLIVVADRGYAVLEPLAKFCDFRDFPKTQPLILRVLGTRVFWNSNFSAETKSWRHFPKTNPHFLKAMNTRSLVPICLIGCCALASSTRRRKPKRKSWPSAFQIWPCPFFPLCAARPTMRPKS